MERIPSIEALLAEDDWLRRLARRLVSDSNQADDLAQDAWLAALEGPKGIHALRPWLSGVLRNLVRASGRSEARRLRRERSTARDEALPSTAELVEQVSLRQDIANHVLALDEPFRSTIYLHFFRNLPLKTIAKRTGVPTSTVHDRVQRGLERIRVRMNRSSGARSGSDGEQRSAWTVAALALARSPGALRPSVSGSLTKAIVGGIMKSTGVMAVAAAVVLATAVGIWRQGHDTRDPELLAPAEPPTGSAVGNARLLGPADQPLVQPAVEHARAEVAVHESPEAGPDAAPDPVGPEIRTQTLAGRVVDTSRQPVGGIEVQFRLQGGSKVDARATSDGNGRFTMERTGPPVIDTTPLFAKLAGGDLRAVDPLFATLAVGIVNTDELVVIVAPKQGLTGRVVDEAGVGIPKARVAVRVRQGLYRDMELTQFVSMPESTNWQTWTDASGSFTIAETCAGEHVFLDAHHPGYAPNRVDLLGQDVQDLVVVLDESRGAIAVRGRVVDGGGTGVPRAQVSMGSKIELTDRDGLFTLHWNPAEEARYRRFYEEDLSDEELVARQAPDAMLQITALKPGYSPALLELEEAALSSPVLLRMGGRPLSISGRVRDTEGRALGGIVVWAADLTPFGELVLQQGEHSTKLQTTVEEQLRGGLHERGAVTAADGSFELAGLLPRRYDIRSYDPETGTNGPGAIIEAGTSGVLLVLDHGASLERVAGCLVSATGAPIPGVVIHVERVPSSLSHVSYDAPPEALTRDRTTDEHGCFEFPALATEGTTLRLFGKDIFFRYIHLSEHEDLAHLDLVEPLLCELEVLLESDPDSADQLRVLDENGNALTTIVSFGSLGNTMTETVKVEDGRSRILRVPETARTLVLLEGTSEVSRSALELDFEQRTVVRF